MNFYFIQVLSKRQVAFFNGQNLQDWIFDSRVIRKVLEMDKRKPHLLSLCQIPYISLRNSVKNIIHTDLSLKNEISYFFSK